MTAAEIIALAIEGVKLATNAIESANSGDIETAKANLAAARDHYAKAGAAWDAAG